MGDCCSTTDVVYDDSQTDQRSLLNMDEKEEEIVANNPQMDIPDNFWDTPIPGETICGPSCQSFRNKLYVVMRGNDSKHSLLVTSYPNIIKDENEDIVGWSTPIAVPNSSSIFDGYSNTLTSPALCTNVDNNILYLVYTTKKDNKYCVMLQYSRNGTNWSKPQIVPFSKNESCFTLENDSDNNNTEDSGNAGVSVSAPSVSNYVETSNSASEYHEKNMLYVAVTVGKDIYTVCGLDNGYDKEKRDIDLQWQLSDDSESAIFKPSNNGKDNDYSSKLAWNGDRNITLCSYKRLFLGYSCNTGKSDFIYYSSIGLPFSQDKGKYDSTWQYVQYVGTNKYKSEKSDKGPTFCVVNGELYCIFKSISNLKANSNEIMFTKTNNHARFNIKWQKAKSVNHTTDCKPSATVLGEQMYVFYKKDESNAIGVCRIP